MTQALVRELLNADYQAGTLTWRERGRHHFKTKRAHSTWNAQNAGQPAFTALMKSGYKQGSIFKKLYQAHRVIFLHAHGWLPEQVDHENGDITDNRISNLRPANNSINGRNKVKYNNNTSGITGVSLHKKTGKWQVNVNTKYLGLYDTKEEAKQAVIAKRKELGGFTERHGQ